LFFFLAIAFYTPQFNWLSGNKILPKYDLL